MTVREKANLASRTAMDLFFCAGGFCPRRGHRRRPDDVRPFQFNQNQVKNYISYVSNEAEKVTRQLRKRMMKKQERTSAQAYDHQALFELHE